MFQKIAKHRANDASNDVHRPPLLLLNIWLSGGKVNKSTILSSVLLIGKVGAENLLNDGEQLKGKSFFWERVLLIL